MSDNANSARELAATLNAMSLLDLDTLDRDELLLLKFLLDHWHFLVESKLRADLACLTGVA